MTSSGTLAFLPGSASPAAAAAAPIARDGIGVDDIFAGADVGLALFGADLSLLACNSRYRSLCGYGLNEAATGKTLQDMMRITFHRQNVPDAEIEQRIDKIIKTLEPGTSYTFRYASPSAQVVEVRRRRLPNGTVVETVRQVDAPAQGMDLNTQFEMIAEKSRARLMHALDVMEDGFSLYDSNDRLVLYNRKYVDYSPLVSDIIMPGAAKIDILRNSVERGSFVLNGMSKEDYIAWRLHLHRNPGDPIEVQFTDGRWILISEKRTDDGGIVGTRSDITELKRREIEMLRISQQLHAKNMHFDSALGNMVQGLCMFDRDQRLIVVNRRYLEIYGFSPEVVKPGITLRGLMEYSVSLGNYTVEEAERALAERNDPARLRVRTVIKQRLKDGRIIAVMNEPMEDGGTIATYQDITDTERSAEKMIEYTKKLERSNRELADFAYVASHDLQEPLRKIEAFGDRLVKKYAATLPEEGRMFVNRMQSAAERMRLLISDLLSYSRITTNANPFEFNDLDEVVSGVLSDLQIRIEDNGIGFDNQFREQIFTIFQRLHSRNEYEGTGIGLATCRKIVERHQGLIEADGKPGEGSIFTITIPIQQTNMENAA